MGRKEYIEETKGAKERFNRAMQTIFQAPKKQVEKPKKDDDSDASSQQDSDADKG